MSFAWKIGRAIKPLSGHTTLVFSPDNAGSRRVSKRRGVVRRKSSPNIGTTIYIEGFQWSHSDGGGEASPARAAGGSEMAEARPAHRPLRFRRPAHLSVGRQAASDRTRGTGPAPRAEALRLQECKVGARRHVHGRGRARVLGGPRVQQHRGSVDRGPLLLLMGSRTLAFVEST